ncbi:hypothetical protein [Bacillus sp. FJAT-27916]|uniref:hypothetical protein n=1 Tax=Bacillus sp. FJAT-27916 TaxID=1679169 RepID=UPI0006710B93|nr:hypothetical protein [Bacillus sp. FJAT-27916]
MELKDSIELSFEYVRKQPQHLPELIHKIRETFSFEPDDQQFGFFRQHTLFDVLISGLKKEDALYSAAFYELAKTFLKFTFESVKAGRENKIIYYKYDLPNIDILKSFRKVIWDTINTYFHINNKMSLDLLSTYCDEYTENKDLVFFDKEYILKLITKHLNPTVFEHCLIVQRYLDFLSHNSEMESNEYTLKTEYTNDLYKIYCRIDLNRISVQEEYDFDEDLQIKEQVLRKSFVFQSTVEATDFIEKYLYLINFIKDDWNQNRVLDIIIDENFNNNTQIGLFLIELIIGKNNDLNYVPHLVFEGHLSNIKVAKKILTLLEKKSFNARLNWIICFYENKKTHLNSGEVNQFIGFLKTIDENVKICLGRLTHLKNIQIDFYDHLLKTITIENRERDNIVRIESRDNSLLLYLESINNIEIIKEMYFQQIKVDSYFDYSGTILKYILRRDADYLIEFTNKLYYKGDRNFHNRIRLGFIWDIENIGDTLEKIADLILVKEDYFVSTNHFCNVFFKGINSQNIERARDFIIGYVKNNYQNIIKINFIMDIIHNTKTEWFDDVIIAFIKESQDPSLFSKIRWLKNNRSIIGDQLFSDLEITDWKKILETINKIDLGIKLIPIKQYVVNRIEHLINSSEEERRHKFINGF